MQMNNEFVKHIAESRLDKRVAEAKEKAKAMAKDGTTTIIEHPGPGQEIIIKRIELPAKDGKKEMREEVNVNIIRANGSGPANAFAHGFVDGDIGRALGESMRLGPIGMSLQDAKWSSKSTTTALGTKEIEGVRVDGKCQLQHSRRGNRQQESHHRDHRDLVFARLAGNGVLEEQRPAGW